MKYKTNIIWSETWLKANFEDINAILQETFNDFIDKTDTIINIEVKTEMSGLSRFWIYTITK